MRSSVISLAFLAAATVLAAQQAAPAAKKPAASLLTIPSAAKPCSIAAMHATQGSSSQMLRTNDGKNQPMMRPSLTLTPRDGRKIVAATVTAHGYSAEPGTMDLTARFVPDGKGKSRREITKIVSIKMQPGESGGFTGEIELPGFSAVTLLELNSATFSDGSTWRVEHETGCSIAPDPLLLIAAQ